MVNTKLISQSSAESKPSHRPRPSPRRLSPAEISALAPMADILQELGFHVNARTHRAPCVLHGGRNPSAFSWTESGEWFCHNCGFGGDRFELVKRVKNCGFRDALAFLAHLSGVELSSHRPTSQQWAERRRKEERAEYDTEKLRLIEGHLRARYREEIHKLEQLKQKASRILKEAPEHGGSNVFAEWAWDAVELATKWLPRLLAGYSILCFAGAKERATFALYPEQAEQITGETLQRAYVTDDPGRMVEVLA